MQMILREGNQEKKLKTLVVLTIACSDTTNNM